MRDAAADLVLAVGVAPPLALVIMVSILCFGDSLTEGYTFQESGEFHPYSIALTRLLKEHFHDASSLTIDTAGVSGELVVSSMTHRLDKLLNERSSKPYDWVIILGGTNDLGTGRSGAQLLPHILALHDRAKSTGCTKTLALALPQYLHELRPGNDRYRKEKAYVNEGLKTYSQGSGGSTLFVDLWNDLPFGSLPAEERALYWVDGLHMTPRGYDKMAGLIYDVLKSNL